MAKLSDLSLDQLWAVFSRLVDPDGVPVGVYDAREREQLRRQDAGTYLYGALECRSRRVILEEAEQIVTFPEPVEALPAPEDWDLSQAG